MQNFTSPPARPLSNRKIRPWIFGFAREFLFQKFSLCFYLASCEATPKPKSAKSFEPKNPSLDFRIRTRIFVPKILSLLLPRLLRGHSRTEKSVPGFSDSHENFCSKNSLPAFTSPPARLLLIQKAHNQLLQGRREKSWRLFLSVLLPFSDSLTLS